MEPQIMTAILAAASAIVLLSNAAEKIVKAWKAAKAPNDRQDKRLTELERDMVDVKAKLERDKRHLDSIDESNRVTQVALLALLDHGIDGNNTKQMQHAKEELQNHLINR
jgi:hypothetical protein